MLTSSSNAGRALLCGTLVIFVGCAFFQESPTVTAKVEDAALDRGDGGADAAPDGGPDMAQLSDAALPDAALPDAAMLDAAMLDAALPDAAQPDAALPDAALPDAALLDAALPDAALPDARIHVPRDAGECAEVCRAGQPITLPVGGFGVDLVEIEGGCFTQCEVDRTCGDPGLPAGADGATVRIPGTLRIQTTEVTRALWRQVTGGDAPPGACMADACPAVGMSWTAAARFANRLSELGDTEGRCYDGLEDDCSGDAFGSDDQCDVIVGNPGCAGYRLPTDAEWMLAARARGDSPFGDQDLPCAAGCLPNDNVSRRTVFCGSDGQQEAPSPAPVGVREANCLGVHDLLGNVREWIHDRPDDCSGAVPEDGERVVRGGSYLSSVEALSIGRRRGADGTGDSEVGVRLVYSGRLPIGE